MMLTSVPNDRTYRSNLDSKALITPAEHDLRIGRSIVSFLSEFTVSEGMLTSWHVFLVSHNAIGSAYPFHFR